MRSDKRRHERRRTRVISGRHRQRQTAKRHNNVNRLRNAIRRAKCHTGRRRLPNRNIRATRTRRHHRRHHHHGRRPIVRHHVNDEARVPLNGATLRHCLNNHRTTGTRGRRRVRTVPPCPLRYDANIIVDPCVCLCFSLGDHQRRPATFLICDYASAIPSLIAGYSTAPDLSVRQQIVFSPCVQ